MRAAPLAWILAVGVDACSPPLLTAQTPAQTSTRPNTSTVPRAPDGHPDLQGIWLNDTITPMERPKRFADKEFLTEEEAAEYEKDYLGRVRETFGDLEVKTSGELAEISNEGGKVVPSRRTSLILAADGKVPPLTAEAKTRADARADAKKQHPTDGPEDLSLWERCLLSPFRAPMQPLLQNPNIQIVQTRDYLVIHGEVIHDARIIPLDNRPHLPKTVRKWMGDSVGRWEGDTLVIDTTNFTDKTPLRGSDDAMHLIERFTLDSADVIHYEFTVDDPSAFTAPWSAAIPLKRSDGPIYEYACHEGNYSIVGILRCARAEEKRQEDR
jgi:hypothetical protein